MTTLHYVYILRDASGRHYIGVTNGLTVRLEQHRRGHTATTKRLGGDLVLLASHAFSSRPEALAPERRLKAWKNPAKALAYLQSLAGYPRPHNGEIAAPVLHFMGLTVTPPGHAAAHRRRGAARRASNQPIAGIRPSRGQRE